MKYRADIDGLRAIAVLAVVADHAQISQFAGGYIGVDVFFVISGFLITGLLLSDLEKEQFSISTFYERRIRRIVPALAVVLLASLPAAYRSMLPSELLDFCKSMLAAVFSCSNIYFWLHTGYFDAPALSKPLLHTWSLAVEEQFYLFLPLFLWGWHRKFGRRYLAPAIAIVAVVSFAWAEAGVRAALTGPFYLLPPRAWELSLGSLLALGRLPGLSNRIVREIAAVVGLVMVLTPIFLYGRLTPFPGIAALPPCLGTVLLITVGQSGPTFVSMLLATRPMVFIGLISYSLYLWHWPIIVFRDLGAISLGQFSSKAGKIVVIIVSIAVSWASWKFVETPFRGKQLTRRFVFLSAAAAAVLLACASSVAIATGGFPARFPKKSIDVAAYLDYDSNQEQRNGTCFITGGGSSRNSEFNRDVCLHRDDTKRNYLLLGDSHAADLWYGLSTVLTDVNVMQANASLCFPYADAKTRGGNAGCSRLMSSIWEEYLPKNPVDALLISARWDGGDLKQLADTLQQAKKYAKSVVLFGPIVQYEPGLPRLLAFVYAGADPATIEAHQLDRYNRADAIIAQVAKENNVRYISLHDELREGDHWVTTVNGNVPIQFDYGHMTGAGQVWLIEKLKREGKLP